MFDIGWSELMVIGVVSLIVVGPKDLPGMFHSLGRITAKARSMAREFSRAMEDAADTAGIKDAAKDFKDLTSKKSLGLDKLEQVASNFEKWEPKLPSGLKAPAGPPSLQPDPDAPPPAMPSPAMPSIEDEAAEDAAEAALSAPKPARKAAPKKAAKPAANVEGKAAAKAAVKTQSKATAKAPAKPRGKAATDVAAPQTAEATAKPAAKAAAKKPAAAKATPAKTSGDNA